MKYTVLFSVSAWWFVQLVVCEVRMGVKEVSYGSSIKLAHKETGYRLHSHDVKYGSGSRENSVTGNRFAHDPNSLWLVKPKLGAPVLEQGTPVKCGDTIRLEHVATGCNLHTHKVRSPLSSQWEVCADGYRDDASDPGDNFNVECLEGSDHWLRGEQIRLKHPATGLYLGSSAKYAYGAPVQGQLEIFSTWEKTQGTVWHTKEGLYFPVHN
mmetsp:Transcript_5558/g.23614  ORF Transcript_5558/g.23614 Transcript_5558/m.23614 type:complete len:211 (-) Transcript_5558:2103-2735(-)